MFEEVVIPVKKRERQNLSTDISLKEGDEEELNETKNNSEEREINVNKLAFEYNLDKKEKKDLSELIQAIGTNGKIHSGSLAFYLRELPTAVLQTTEIKSLVKNKLTESLLQNENVGGLAVYAENFGVNQEFFADKKFDSYRKNFWQQKLAGGANMDFALGKQKADFYISESEEEKMLGSALNGEYNETKKLFTAEELNHIGLEGALAAAKGGAFSLEKKEQRINGFQTYKNEFALKNEDMSQAMIADIKKNIFRIELPNEIINEYPEVKKFIESPEAKELAKETALNNIALGFDADACLERFKINKNELSQEEIIKKTNQNIENNKIQYSFHLDTFSKYIDDEHLPKLGEATLKLSDSLKQDFLDKHFRKASWFNKGKDEKNELNNFKKLNLPQEVLTNFVQDGIIYEVKRDNYSKENDAQDKDGQKFFGVGEQEKQAALSIGFFQYALNHGPQYLNDPDDYTKKKIGLNGFTFTPKFRQNIKEEYLAAIKNGYTLRLDPINEFLDKENENIKWEVTDRPQLREAAAEGIVNVCNGGRDKIKAFADKYYPDRHKFFLFNPEYKARVMEKLTSSIQTTTRLEYTAINRKNLLEAISYFNLDEKEIFNQVEKTAGFLKSYNGLGMIELLPEFNVDNHNKRWISEQEPQTVLDLAISQKNYELLSELSKHENTKGLIETELAKTEAEIANTPIFAKQTNETIEQTATNIWIIKSSFSRSALGKGLEGQDEKQIIFAQENPETALILKHMSALSPENRKESAIIKLAARKNEGVFALIQEVMHAAEIGGLSLNLEKKLESDFGIKADNFKEGGVVNTEKILSEIEKSIEENFDANLNLNKPLTFDTATKPSLLNALADTEVAVLSGDKELKNEELFSKIYRKYLGKDEQRENRFGTVFNRSTNEKMSTKDNNFFGEKDWGAALVKYVESIEGERGNQGNQKEQITDLFSGPYRDVCLNGMSAEWNKFLKNDTQQEIPLRLRLIADTIDKYGGAGNLSRIETFSSIITAIKNVSENEKIIDKTKTEIKNTLSNAETRFEKEKWTQDDKTEFYGLAKDIIEASPSLFSSLSPVFENMSGKEMKQFVKEMFPLYQAELITMQKINTKGEIEYDARNLVPIRRAIKHLMADLSAQPGKKEEIVKNEKENLVTNIRLQFKDRFGIVNVPAELNNENFRSVHNLIRYTGNMNGRESSKEALISLYLGLQLNGDWEKFRRGEKI